MAGNLFPVWDMPPTTAQLAATVPPPAYPPSPAFDFEAGEFVLDGQGRCVILDGPAAWVQWCTKACLIQRNAAPIYTANYGCDLDQITAAPSHEAAEQTAQDAITRCLLADPRTRAVGSFTFAWAGDALAISFQVTPVVGSSQSVQVALRA